MCCPKLFFKLLGSLYILYSRSIWLTVPNFYGAPETRKLSHLAQKEESPSKQTNKKIILKFAYASLAVVQAISLDLIVALFQMKQEALECIRIKWGIKGHSGDETGPNKVCLAQRRDSYNLFSLLNLA